MRFCEGIWYSSDLDIFVFEEYSNIRESLGNLIAGIVYRNIESNKS